MPDKMDTTKLGLATAKAMDEIEKFAESGDIDESGYIGAVVIVVAIDAKTPDDHPNRDLLRDVATQAFVFSVPEEVYIQEGVLRMGLRNYHGSADALED